MNQTSELKAFSQAELNIEAVKQYVSEVDISTEITDSKSLKSVHDNKMLLKNKRLDIQKVEKNVVDGLKERIKEVKSHAQDMIDIIKPHEDAMHSAEQEYKERLAEEKRRKEEQERKRIQGMVDQLFQYGVKADPFELMAIDEDEFEGKLSQAKQDWQAEQERLQKEAQEQQRIQKENEELRRKLAEAEAKQKAMEEAAKPKTIEVEAKDEAAAASPQPKEQSEEDKVRSDIEILFRHHFKRMDQPKKDLMEDVIAYITQRS